MKIPYVPQCPEHPDFYVHPQGGACPLCNWKPENMLVHLIHATTDEEAIVYGPFPTDEAACDWAVARFEPGTWHYVSAVLAPSMFDLDDLPFTKPGPAS